MRILVLLLVLVTVTGCSTENSADGEPAADASRVVALGGSVAETVFALGAKDALVGRDMSGVYPEAVQALPSVGYFRMVPAEGVLGLEPTLVLADPDAGPPSALEQIEQAGVEVRILPGGASPDSTAEKVRAIAAALGREEAGETVIDSMQAKLERARQIADAAGERPRILFVLAQEAGGQAQVAGTGTNANTFIDLSGGVNAFTGAEGYKPLSAEAVVDAQPDVIIMLARTAGILGGPEAFLERPEIAPTPAAQNGRIVVLPDATMSFGPGLGGFVLDFVEQLHGEA